MTADAPGEEPAASEEADASWLRRLYEFETRRREGTGPPDRRPEPGSPEDASTEAQGHAGDSLPEAGLGPAGHRRPRPRRTRRSRPDEGSKTGEREATSPLLRAIRREAGFDAIGLVGSPADHAYGRTARATVGTGDERLAVSLRLFRRPDTEAEGLEDALATQLERWAEVGEVPGVVPVLDAASSPRPWACTAPVGPSLRTVERRSITRALRDARRLARALDHLHERGVVHTGLDPDTVVYPTDRTAGRTEPLLDVPGLLDVYRRYVDPATILDPRYAAPEYYETDRGVVDRATDVYQFGAVLFTLLTGRPPYDGDAGAVREAVLADAVPLPSSVEPRVPTPVDDLVERAMQPAKFDRFETAAELATAVEEVCRSLLEE